MWTRNWIEGLHEIFRLPGALDSSNATNHWLVLDHGSQDKPQQVSTSTANRWTNRRTCRHHISLYCRHIPCISQHEIQIAPLLVPRHHIGDREHLLGTATLARGGGLRWRLCGYGRPAALGIGKSSAEVWTTSIQPLWHRSWRPSSFWLSAALLSRRSLLGGRGGSWFIRWHP